ncbi:hypothetical protein DQ04_09061020 [Trypanosoma grayi]|uniref:hypothetical protein n=1 Tax=Trypanosoma grayi TaxID=71804 RepID=UPI0004F447CB|nr:hypothetical protein DQ04_09061020 [Trypanosoma grayi]KEG07695.1 hypothetical protein DQ04_09061020 [Trypanosoma grayi]
MAPDLPQGEDTWIPDLVALAKRCLRIQNLMPSTCRSGISGHWSAARNDFNLPRKEEASMACFCTSDSHRYGRLLRSFWPTMQSTRGGCNLGEPHSLLRETKVKRPANNPEAVLLSFRNQANCTVCQIHFSCR